MDNILHDKPLHYGKNEQPNNNIDKEIIEKNLFELMPKKTLVYGCKGTGKSHFAKKYACWLMREDSHEQQNDQDDKAGLYMGKISAIGLENKIARHQRNQKMQYLNQYPDYLKTFFIEKNLKPLLAKANQAYQDFFIPKKIDINTQKDHFAHELQDFMSKNMQLETEAVEIFLENINPTNQPKKSKETLKKYANTKNTKQKLTENYPEKIVLLGIQDHQLVYEIHHQTQQITSTASYVEVSLLGEIYEEYLQYNQEIKNKGAEKNIEKNIEKNTEKEFLSKYQKEKHFIYFKAIIETILSQKNNQTRPNIPTKPQNYVLLLDNVELALRDKFWQDIIWAFCAKRGVDTPETHFFLCPNGEKLPIPPNFYVVCVLPIWEQDFIHQAFIYDYALVKCGLEAGFLQSKMYANTKQFFYGLNDFIAKEKSELYCLGAYFYENVTADMFYASAPKFLYDMDILFRQLLEYTFDCYIFHYLKNLFSDYSLEKLSQKLQEVGIKTALIGERLTLVN